jgi:hypothetical protein
MKRAQNRTKAALHSKSCFRLVELINKFYVKQTVSSLAPKTQIGTYSVDL